MSRVEVNGVELFYEAGGDGDPLVLVHGSWGDHEAWAPVVHALALRFRVLVYDRRGHSQSERPPGPGSRFEDEEDLAALMETLGFAPAYVAGNSFGASTVLGLASRRPELFRGIIAHDPPLMGLLADDSGLLPSATAGSRKIESVLEHLRADRPRAAVRQFVEEVVLEPGAWDQLPERVRDTFVANAPTFLDEQADPGWADLDLGLLSGHTGPALLSKGTQSPPWFAAITDRLSKALPQAETHTFEGAGHIPHISHPETYVERLISFVDGNRNPA
ncbi:alpha/beta hydrolase [Streptomyces sp. NBC_00249]|uniref:alpha/beta fold hydrolase n=1 Tax=Streptomyces sp. NBC_00249 TaxID=2975690 RepID=UPI002253EA62|nr:alpha/beta hydrolase [Streptomyces sp. NBC_00249]MCX5199414.1 alpha/beta hydrolase [Streptomyces sp. NBC_00249]